MNKLMIYNESSSSMMNIHSEGDMINLTDLWREAGSQTGKEVWRWQETESAIGFLSATCKILNLAKNDVLKSKRGKNGGTWAHKQIALEYSQYLDPKLAVLVNQVFFERIEEEKNPGLAIERGIKGYEKKGKTSQWIEARFQGIQMRNEFTKTLAAHGVKQNGFSICTNAIYQPLFGGSTEVIRHKKGLENNQKVRDNMSDVELTAVKLSELLARDNIEANNLKGNGECELACRHSSKSVANAIIQSRRQVLTQTTF